MRRAVDLTVDGPTCSTDGCGEAATTLLHIDYADGLHAIEEHCGAHVSARVTELTAPREDGSYGYLRQWTQPHPDA